MFDPFWKMALGLVTGIIFGFLLQKGRVAKYRVILGQFLLRDWTVVKVMGTAVIVGMVGIYGLLPTGTVALHIKPLVWAGVLTGGVCFGAGMAIFGYCPGTGVAACGEGRRDAMVGILGMLAGAGAYVAFYPLITQFVSGLGSAGSITFAQWTGTSPWAWIGGLLALALLLILPRQSRLQRSSRSGQSRATRKLTH